MTIATITESLQDGPAGTPDGLIIGKHRTAEAFVYFLQRDDNAFVSVTSNQAGELNLGVRCLFRS